MVRDSHTGRRCRGEAELDRVHVRAHDMHTYTRTHVRTRTVVLRGRTRYSTMRLRSLLGCAQTTNDERGLRCLFEAIWLLPEGWGLATRIPAGRWE